MSAIPRAARIAVVLSILAAAGCTQAIVSSMTKGGEMIDASYRPNVLVSYREDGAEVGGELALVDTTTGPAMLLRGTDGTGFLLRTHWRDERGDHFALYLEIFGEPGQAMEVVVPSDRSKNAVFLSYAPGTYKAVSIGGKLRPVPRPAAEFQRSVLLPQ